MDMIFLHDCYIIIVSMIDECIMDTYRCKLALLINNMQSIIWLHNIGIHDFVWLYVAPKVCVVLIQKKINFIALLHSLFISGLQYYLYE